MEMNFLQLLNEIKNKEYLFRDIQKIEIQGHDAYTGPDVLKKEYDYVLCFLVYVKYSRIANLNNLQKYEDVKYALTQSRHKKAKDALSIWIDFEDKYPYIDKLLKLLGNYDFTSFQDEENEVVLAKWGTTNCLTYNGEYDNVNILTIYNVIQNCQKQLGIDMERGKILLSINVLDIIEDFFIKKPTNADVYFDIRAKGCYLQRINLLLNCYNNFHLIKDLSNEQFDGIIYTSNDEEKEWENYNQYLKKDGFCLALNNNVTQLSDFFFNHEILAAFDTEKFSLLYRNREDRTKIVRYAGFYCENSFFLDTNLITSLTECIKNSVNRDFFQILSKDDFRYTGKFHFVDVKRKPDQLDFVWKNKEEIFRIKDDGKWLWDYNIDEEKIINYSSFSDSPFKINLPEEMYLSDKIYQNNGGRHILEEFEIDKNKGIYKIPDKYSSLFYECYDMEANMDDKCKAFDKLLCCRVLTHRTLLYENGRIIRVNASPQKPACYRNYGFGFEDSEMRIVLYTGIDEIEIYPEYDENFIIYLLMMGRFRSSKALLVAPTKEEQHTYFLSKRLDYLSKFQPVVDEMEIEIQKSISEYPTFITGAGFKNFRRFSNLSLLELFGVNIFVGGNNSGKSTFVKGLLLALDNIKNLRVDNNDNTLISPTFQFDSNTYHNVHIGTFNRSYSANPIIDERNPKKKYMSFTIACAHFVIELVIVPIINDDSPKAPIATIIIKDNKRNASFCFDFENSETSADFIIGDDVINYHYSGLRFNQFKFGDYFIPTLIRGMIPSENHSVEFRLNQDVSEKLKGKSGFLLEIADELETIINNTRIEYIYAHGINQKILFNYNDKNDYMAETLHDLMVEKIGEIEHEFICKWLHEFGLGVDYDIHSIGGEAYIIQLKTDNGNMVYLADMGMGSNQLVILIFRLAIIIHRHRMVGNKPYRPTIIIEEPEQNMHPAFQSKLAILFNDVNSEYGFNFIVETHSEYLVRRSQVIVAQQKYPSEDELRKKCPFKVYYFPSEGVPYEMMYRTDGNFGNDFGNGFYDEANNLLFEII